MVKLEHPNGFVSFFKAGTGMNRNQVERFILKQGYSKTTETYICFQKMVSDGTKTATIHSMDDLSKFD